MRPIEQVHRQILAGNVLSSSGTWIPRVEALKRKRIQLKHVFDGEVEIEGKWVKLSSIETRQKVTPFLAKETPAPKPERIATLRKQVAQAEASPIKSVSPFEKKPPVLEEPTENPVSPPENHLVSGEHEHSPSQSSDSAQPGDKQTITIRTLSLGKETVLTISESRAGNALVAICSIQGFIDQTNADELNAQLMSMLDFGVRFFIIDFELTNLIGSAGWGVLAVASRLIKASLGHLLICAMSTDIEESFLLLQFNEVIDSRKNISDCLDAIDTFQTGQVILDENTPHVEKDSFHNFGDSWEDLPLQEKIKTIISHNGPIGFFALKKLLGTQRYGNVKMGSLRLYVVLKELNLESKWKRVRFYRSC